MYNKGLEMSLKRSLLIGSVALALFSCSKDGSGLLGKDKNATPNEFIESYNLLIEAPRELTDEYFKKFDTKELNIKTKNPRLFPRHRHATSDVKKIHDLVSAGKKKNGKLPIVPFADSAVLAMDSIVSIFENAYNYYDSKDYKSDNWEKGKTFHASMATYDALLNRSIRNMSEILQKEEEARDKKKLDSIKKKDGFVFRYRSYNYAMKIFQRTVGTEEQAASLTKLESEMTALIEYVDKHKAHKMTSVFEAYKQMAQAYTNTAKKISNSDPKVDDINDLMDDLTSDYNSVISTSNSVSEMEAKGYID